MTALGEKLAGQTSADRPPFPQRRGVEAVYDIRRSGE
jgi:hypothetical protein